MKLNVNLNSGEPLVSVLVVTYNHEKFIEQTLQGILMQNVNFIFEVVIGDDCSTDGTQSIVKSYQQKYSDIIKPYSHKRNLGKRGQLNFVHTLSRCKGQYIAIIEGDDYWTDKYKLQKQVDVLVNNPNISICHHWHSYLIEENGSNSMISAPKLGHGYLNKEIATVREIFQNKLRIKSRTMMIRKSAIYPLPNWFLKCAYGDVTLSFIAGKSGTYFFIDEPMAVYRVTNTGASTQGLKEKGTARFLLEQYMDYIKIWDMANKHYDYLYNKEAIQTISNFYNKIFYSNGITFAIYANLFSFNFFKRKTRFSNKIKAFVLITKVFVSRFFHVA